MVRINLYFALILCLTPLLITSLQLKMNINQKNLNRLGDNTLRQLFEQNLNYNMSLITANICLGSPKQCFNLAYDIGIHQTWVVDQKIGQYVNNAYIPATSKTSIHQGGNFFVDTHYGYEVKDQIQFTLKDSTTVIKSQELYSFIVIYELKEPIKLPYDGALGLNRKYHEKEITVERQRRVYANLRYSLIDYLFDNKYINRRVFSHKPISKTSAILYLGETGTDSKQFYQTCSSLSTAKFEGSAFSNYWHCDLLGIYDQTSGTSLMEYPLTAVFDSNAHYIAFPLKPGKVVFEHLQANGLDQCKPKYVMDMGYSMICSEIDRLKLPDLAFRIGGFNLTITHEDYIEEKIITDVEGNTRTAFQVKMINNNYLLMSIVIGGYALMKQQMIFDYENNSVGFIALKETEMVKGSVKSIENGTLLKFLMSCCIVMMSISIAFGLTAIFLNKKRFR